MDEFRNAFSFVIIKLMCKKAKRRVTYSLEPYVVMGCILFRLRWSEDPLVEELIQMICILALLIAVFKFYSVRSTAVLRF